MTISDIEQTNSNDSGDITYFVSRLIKGGGKRNDHTLFTAMSISIH